MPTTHTRRQAIRGVATCVPPRVIENADQTRWFSAKEIDSVIRMAGVRRRRAVEEGVCSSDLCLQAARELLEKLEWSADSIDAVIMVTQSPDYFQPSTSCVLHRALNLSDECAAFDLGLGCSGYTYGLWMSSLMMQTAGFNRVLLLHGETPTQFVDPRDRSVGLLFGDAGSATAIESPGTEPNNRKWWFSLHTDGSGSDDLIIAAGGFRDRFSTDRRLHSLRMDGAAIMNFTLSRVPPLIKRTIEASEHSLEDVDYFIFHQSNRFIMNHLLTKCGLRRERVPMTLENFGNTGGPSVPLTITQGALERPDSKALTLLLIAYGVGLSWASAMVDLPPDAVLLHSEFRRS